MLISFDCPHCQTALQVGSDFAGKPCLCPKCKKKITIPEKDSEIQSEQQETAKKE
jgi:hypothetical protein